MPLDLAVHEGARVHAAVPQEELPVACGTGRRRSEETESGDAAELTRAKRGLRTVLLAVDVLALVAEELVRVLERPDAVPHIVVDVARVLLRINRARRRSAAELMERSELLWCSVSGWWWAHPAVQPGRDLLVGRGLLLHHPAAALRAPAPRGSGSPGGGGSWRGAGGFLGVQIPRP